jgi:diacylglycerol kinase family enzyme
VTAVPTTGPDTAGDLVRGAIRDGADVILVAGGDGTINEAIQGMAGSQIPLGVIPVGTANVLGCEMRVKGGPEGAARALGSWVPRRISMGFLRNEANPHGRFFLLMAGIGLDAHIVYGVKPDLKRRFGKAAYWMAGFGQLGKTFPEFEASANGRSVRASFALASRVRNYGGDLEIANGASLLADTFEAVLFEGRQSWMFMKYFAGVLVGRHGSMKGVSVIRTSSLELRCPTDPSIYVQVDGESAGSLPADITIAPETLSLLVPPAFVRSHG